MTPREILIALWRIDFETLPVHLLSRFLSAITCRWELADLFALAMAEHDEEENVLVDLFEESPKRRRPTSPHEDPNSVIVALEASNASDWSVSNLRGLGRVLDGWVDLETGQRLARMTRGQGQDADLALVIGDPYAREDEGQSGYGNE